MGIGVGVGVRVRARARISVSVSVSVGVRLRVWLALNLTLLLTLLLEEDLGAPQLVVGFVPRLALAVLLMRLEQHARLAQQVHADRVEIVGLGFVEQRGRRVGHHPAEG